MLRYIPLWLFAFALLFGWEDAQAVEADTTIHSTPTCTSSTTTALAANLGRKAALFVNDGAATIWINIGNSAVANTGIHLAANGGSYYIAWDEANYDTDVINCIVASTSVVLLVTEWSN